MHTAAAPAIVTWYPRPEDRLFAALRYGGVLAVWVLLALVRPKLAWDIFVHRRADSPIPRRRAAWSQ